MGEKIKEKNPDITGLIENVRKQIAAEKGLSAGLKAAIELLIGIVQLLAEKRLSKNSKNSSLPPAMDLTRKKMSKAKKEQKPGGQAGHEGATLEQIAEPDEVKTITVDRSTLPDGKWETVGYEKRQVFDLRIHRHVTEYRAEIVANETGEQVRAEFPLGLVQKAQYGNGVKAEGVYMSVRQLIPCERVSDHFRNQMGLALSGGTVCNFKKEGYELLAGYETWVKEQIKGSKIIHCDETGITIGAKRVWLHSVSNEQYTYYYPHEKRGTEAMDAIGVVGNGGGVMIHDHWKAYYRYENRDHGLCNAHHIRELVAVGEEGQQWAAQMIALLLETNEQARNSGGILPPKAQQEVRNRYQSVLKAAEKENPPQAPPQEKKRGRVAKTKAGNLMERMALYEDDVLRFMTDTDVPFTNNQAERDIRMAKVQQKISGCFRSWDGAYWFLRIRGYLSTCEKHSVSSADALKLLFEGKLPDFIFINT